ncbi:predicted protein [Sclerotinia sclerotiorum 1980 UF-70]|uniref:Uncharacterized protein n=1 Tax=Sclerotinia sclerotiorum (strain ATCC 18683 / 1980 / Ss-1) TaxID=665079 RepID=A7EJ35_SCLS1|nr:predicted protein [Sclerotinia sclerotiorum 1980 UF-70]EDO02851.1 predicted protein [Sclerotinia sclerotiorum 1980 UF-70]
MSAPSHGSDTHCGRGSEMMFSKEHKHLSKSLGTTRATSLLLSSSCHPNTGSMATSSGTLEEVTSSRIQQKMCGV